MLELKKLETVLKKFEVRDSITTFHLMLLDEWVKCIPDGIDFEVLNYKPMDDVSVVTISFGDHTLDESFELVIKLMTLIQDNLKREIIVRKQLDSLKDNSDYSALSLDPEMVREIMSLDVFDYMEKLSGLDLKEETVIQNEILEANSKFGVPSSPKISPTETDLNAKFRPEPLEDPTNPLSKVSRPIVDNESGMTFMPQRDLPENDGYEYDEGFEAEIRKQMQKLNTGGLHG